MDPSLARREALRIFRLVLVIKLVILALGFLAVLGLGVPARLGMLLRAAPTLLVILVALPSWLERVLGRSFLALTLGLDVLVESLESIPFFFERSPIELSQLGLSEEATRYLLTTARLEPFFFLLIPLVLLAWGYGQRGALWGSTWATVLHLGTGFWALQQDLLNRGFFIGAVTRIVLLYTVPLIVSILAERERQQHAQLEVAHQRLRRHAATVEQLAISRERNRLARELHDTLAHSLSALSVQLEALRTLLATTQQRPRMQWINSRPWPGADWQSPSRRSRLCAPIRWKPWAWSVPCGIRSRRSGREPACRPT
jgi:signal transduction histidine kinase